MDFKVFTDHNGGFDGYSGEAACWRDGGVLLVEDAGREIVYGPSGWVRVESDGQVRTLAASCEVAIREFPEYLNVWLDHQPIMVTGPEEIERWRKRGR